MLNNKPELEELRKRLLKVDTVFKIDKTSIEQFLLPNYYADRLVDFVTQERRQAVIAELELIAKVSRDNVRLAPGTRAEDFWQGFDFLEYKIEAELKRLQGEL